MAPGAMMDATRRSQVGMFSSSTYGYWIDRSTREKGRLYGELTAKAPPTAAMALELRVSNNV
jgi:hypothetical protein